MNGELTGNLKTESFETGCIRVLDSTEECICQHITKSKELCFFQHLSMMNDLLWLECFCLADCQGCLYVLVND